MFREDGSLIMLNDIGQNFVPELFIQYLNFSGRVTFRHTETEEMLAVDLLTVDDVLMIAKRFGIRPVHQY